MRRHRRLSVLHNALNKRVVRLEKLVVDTTGRSIDPLSERQVAYAMIEALSSWSAFIREFYLSCALFQPRTIRGNPVTHSSLAIADEFTALCGALGALGQTYALTRSVSARTVSPRDEPTWHDPSTLVRLSSNIGLSNSTSVLAAFAYPTTFFRDAPAVRNFYAHRNAESAARVSRLAAREYNMLTVRRPSELITTLFHSRGQTLLEEWLEDIRLISYELCL
jgi:hypothetical protein